tara:strand:- start:79 stop:948 length:870 start_codon:yes stop_codon:yes gene_type:complete
MPRSNSPLRYPGGKSSIYDLVDGFIRANNLEHSDYVEPYAGGCGLALSLLFANRVADIHINDLDPAIWSFWTCVLNHTQELTTLIEKTPVTLSEWRKQKEIHEAHDTSNTLALGFATFFLNRTNRSGIIKGAGIIGGFEQQGKYLMDCRYNKADLIRRIKRISSYKSRINLYNLDAVEFMSRASKLVPDESFFCIDPPYYKKGSALYTNFYTPEQHAEVADHVLALKQPWIVTYDKTPEILSLYKSRRRFGFNINYSLQTKKVGNEILIASKGLRLPRDQAQKLEKLSA